MSNNQKLTLTKKITIVGILLNITLGIIKVTSGYYFASHALIADGIHSFSDLISDIMVFFGTKYGNQAADKSHPYGHQRIETAVTFLLSLLLILVGLGISSDAVGLLFSNTHHFLNPFSLAVALFAVLTNEVFFRYSLFIGNKIKSSLIITNAWHHRSDAAASLIVLISLIASFYGWHYFDAIASFLIGLLIIKMGIVYSFKSIKELVDTAVSNPLFDQIHAVIEQVAGVCKIHQLRTRFMGEDIFVDVHVIVKPFISVSEGHFITQHIHDSLHTAIPTVKDITVHIDTEDDELEHRFHPQHGRFYLENRWLIPWQQAFPYLEAWTLHYLNDKIYLDLLCKDNNQQCQLLQQKVHNDLQDQTEIVQVRFLTIMATLPLT